MKYTIAVIFLSLFDMPEASFLGSHVDSYALPALSGKAPDYLDQVTKDFAKLQASKPDLVEFKPLHQNGDCWSDAGLNVKGNIASLLQQENVPGAGIDVFKPFEKVLKDGFAKVDCVKDEMYYFADKFGDNKHDYNQLHRGNVSIVHYDAFVPKEDQAEMTPTICFEFCRTVPNMGFFGIVNGRGCYCTPFYTPMESDSSQCDSVCVGDNTLTCGGESKSTLFAMHMCASTKQDLSKKVGIASDTKSDVDQKVKRAKDLSADMQSTAAKLQKRFGLVGDDSATDLMQSAKQFAGDLVHKGEEADDIATKLGALLKSASELKNFDSPAVVTKAERIMEDIDVEVAKADDVNKELLMQESFAVGQHEARKAWLASDIGPNRKKDWGTSGTEGEKADIEIIETAASTWCGGPYVWGGQHKGIQDCARSCEGKEAAGALSPWFNFAYNKRYGRGWCYCRAAGDCEQRWRSSYWTAYKRKVVIKDSHLKQYYPVMYFVDKAFVDTAEKPEAIVPTTCNGDLAAKPITSQSADECAAACDTNIHNCVGFQYFKDGTNQLCFLLSKFTTGSYYTGCGKSFLQESKAPFKAECYAKLSKFSGTTLKPQPNGKCDQCFTKLTKADRCYK